MEKREEEGRQSCQELGAIRDAWSGDKGIFPAGGCERVLAVGTEWKGNSYLCDTGVSLLDRLVPGSISRAPVLEARSFSPLAIRECVS